MKKSLLTLALAALCTAAPAMAAETYVLLDVGQTSLSNCAGCSKPAAIRVGAGYQYKPNLAFETSYAALGSPTQGGVTLTKLSAFQIAAIGSYPIADAFSLTGKLGLVSAMTDVNTPGFTGTTSLNVSWGLGAQYTVSKQFTVRAQYENLGRFGNSTSPVKGSLLSAGVVMNF
ncbi:MAG: outer membrane beta-barrel protein [Gallionella sp.]|nr:outer membrane beta-barrel protein [Gallionella sp.]